MMNQMIWDAQLGPSVAISFSIFKERDSWLNNSSNVGLMVLDKAFTTESDSLLNDSSNVSLVVLDKTLNLSSMHKVIHYKKAD